MIRRVVVTGSRNHTDANLIRDALDEANPDVVIQGGCRGADAIAKEWADDNGRVSITVPADWALHGRSAGPMRNRKMLERAPDATVLAFPVGRSPGTRGCIKLASDMGMKVVVHE